MWARLPLRHVPLTKPICMLHGVFLQDVKSLRSLHLRGWQKLKTSERWVFAQPPPCLTRITFLGLWPEVEGRTLSWQPSKFDLWLALQQKLGGCDIAKQAWLSLVATIVSLTKGCSMWIGQEVFELWRLASASTKAWMVWRSRVTFKTWHLGKTSIRAWWKSRCHAACKAWLLVITSTMAWKVSPFPVACETWALAFIRPWRVWLCPAYFEAGHSGATSSRGQVWVGRAVFNTWPLGGTCSP